MVSDVRVRGAIIRLAAKLEEHRRLTYVECGEGFIPWEDATEEERRTGRVLRLCAACALAFLAAWQRAEALDSGRPVLSASARFCPSCEATIKAFGERTGFRFKAAAP